MKKSYKIVICIFIILTIIGAIFYLIFKGNFGKLKIRKAEEKNQNKVEIDKILDEKDGINDENNVKYIEKENTELTEEEKRKIEEEELYDFIEAHVEPLKNEKQVFNILLVGTDERGDVKGARSDSMMMVSINDASKEISVTSFMRDIQVKIPKYGLNKLNAAYAYGGIDLLEKTLYNNFNIQTDRYAQIDFDSFIQLFDYIPGIKVDITEAERKEINKFINEVNHLHKKPWGTNNIAKSGNINIENGDQALAYARIRHVGNSDFQRTERQRILIEKAFEQIKKMNIIEINNLLSKVLPLITTDINEGECFGLIMKLGDFKNYKFNSYRIPIDNSFSAGWLRKQSVIKVDFNKNIKFIKENIYKEK